MKPPSLLQYSHWSPSFGADTEENRNLLTWELAEEGGAVRVTFRHGNIATQETKDHSEPMWKMMLDRMKDLLEKTEQPRA